MGEDDDALEAGSLAEINVHLTYMRRELRNLRNMATHEDIKGIKETISNLATRTELEELRKEVTQSKPSTLFFNAVRFAAGVGVLGAFVVLVLQVSDTLNAVKRQAETAMLPKKTPAP